MSTPINDISGKKFGSLTAISMERVNGILSWKCKCDCGNIVYKPSNLLKYSKKNGWFTTCGCGSIDINGEKQVIVGKTFALLSIISYDIDKNLYKCKDKDNKIVMLTSRQVRDRIARSEQYGKRITAQNEYAKQYNCIDSKEYNKKAKILSHTLTMMKVRCYNTKNSKYKYYGGRGIKIYQEWLESSREFINWALLNGFDYGLQIDRMDNDGDYTPTNCRWVTRLENMNNRSDNLYLEYNGEKKSLSSWCRLYNLNYKSTFAKIKYKHISLDDIIKKEGRI